MISNTTAFDRWSLLHGAVGMAAGLARVNFWLFLGAISVYELVEFLMESPAGSKLFGSKKPESAVNMLTDLGIGISTYTVGYLIRQSKT